MIKVMSVAGVMLAIMTTGVAAADVVANPADLVDEAPPVIPVFSWTGFTVGAHAGYDFGRESGTVRTGAGFGSYGSNPNGVVGGLHGGYNRALSSVGDHALVVGVEGDIDGRDYQRSAAISGNGLGNGAAAVRSDIEGSIRARLGVADSRVLYYATGGAAFANFNSHYDATAAFGPGAFDASQRLQAGYTLGGGVEYAFMNYVTVRAEYRYTDFGSVTDIAGSPAAGSVVSLTRRDADNRLQAGLSYKFDSVAP